MVTIARAERLTLPLAPALAIAGGLLVALALLLLPTALLERLVVASGFPAIIAAAEPPLGLTARIALGLILGGGVMAFACLALSLTLGDRQFSVSGLGTLLRRRDVHPDAPPRPPLFAARDLGTPFLEVKAPADGVAAAPRDALDMTPVERDLPRDLDRPLSDFDPGAILLDPFPVAESVAPLAPPLSAESVADAPTVIAVAAAPVVAEPAPLPLPRPALIDPGDRFETFELTPARPAPVSLRVETPAPAAAAPVAEVVVPAAIPEPVVAPETEATVHDLLARLERGISGRVPAPAQARPASVAVPTAPGSLAGTLGDLRRMATSGR